MTNNVTIIDLDAVVPQREVVVKLDGKEHKLAAITLEDYLLNTKLIQQIAAGQGPETDLEKEFEVALDMVGRAFPTIGADRLRKLTLDQLNKLSDVARGNDGTQVAKQEEEKTAEANPTTAG
jgi:hypothetical protein